MSAADANKTAAASGEPIPAGQPPLLMHGSAAQQVVPITGAKSEATKAEAEAEALKMMEIEAWAESVHERSRVWSQQRFIYRENLPDDGAAPEEQQPDDKAAGGDQQANPQELAPKLAYATLFSPHVLVGIVGAVAVGVCYFMRRRAVRM